MGKTLFRYLSRASDIFKKYHRRLQALHVQMLKRMGKVISDLYVPKAKFSTLNCWFLARFNSRKAEQYFSQELSLMQRYVDHRVLENNMQIC